MLVDSIGPLGSELKLGAQSGKVAAPQPSSSPYFSRRSLEDRLAELRELRDTVGSLKKAAEMMGLSYGYVRKLASLHGLSKKHQGNKNVTRPPDVCPECGGSLKGDDENGEVACTSCGLVVDRNHLVPGSEQFVGKAPQNFLMADTCGLGTETQQLLKVLQHKGVIKGYWLKEMKRQHPIVKTLTNFTLSVLSELARRCQQAGFTWESGTTIALAKKVLKEIKDMVAAIEPEDFIDQIWTKYFEAKEAKKARPTWLKCREKGCRNLAFCAYWGCHKKPRPDPTCLTCPERLCPKHT